MAQRSPAARCFPSAAWHGLSGCQSSAGRLIRRVVDLAERDPEASVLDLACRPRMLTGTVARRARAVVAMDPESAMLRIAAHAFTVRHARYRQGGSEDRPGDLGRLRVVTMARSFDSVNRAETLRGPDRMVAPDRAVAPLDARDATGRSVVSEERRAALIGRRPVEVDA